MPSAANRAATDELARRSIKRRLARQLDSAQDWREAARRILLRELTVAHPSPRRIDALHELAGERGDARLCWRIVLNTLEARIRK